MAEKMTQFEYLMNCMEHAGDSGKPFEEGYFEKRQALFAHAVALEKDAARYRWLRTHTHGERDAAGRAEFCMPNPMPRSNIMRGSVAQHLDAAIDADMADYAAVQATAKGLMEKR